MRLLLEAVVAGEADDELIRGATVRRMIEEVRAEMPERPEVVTSKQAAELWSYSADTWSQWCRQGEIEGAWQDGEGGIWRMPYASCEAKVERVRWEARNPNRRKRRGPWNASPSPPGGAGTESFSEGKVVRLRSPPMGRGQTDDARPERPGVAGRRGADD